MGFLACILQHGLQEIVLLPIPPSPYRPSSAVVARSPLWHTSHFPTEVQPAPTAFLPAIPLRAGFFATEFPSTGHDLIQRLLLASPVPPQLTPPPAFMLPAVRRCTSAPASQVCASMVLTAILWVTSKP